MAKIGVFDSGIGGKIVAEHIRDIFQQHEVVFVCDTENVPYGTKPIEVFYRLALTKLRELESLGCDVIVVACNTVTTNCIEELRNELSTPLIGMEPMIKPAASMTQSGVIAVCATPATLSSKRYAWLKSSYAKGVTVLEPDCSDWALMIESDSVDRQKIAVIVDDVCAKKADVIVLGCTHYHWIEDLLKQLVNNRAKVIQPEEPVIRRLAQILEQLP